LHLAAALRARRARIVVPQAARALTAERLRRAEDRAAALAVRAAAFRLHPAAVDVRAEAEQAAHRAAVGGAAAVLIDRAHRSLVLARVALVGRAQARGARAPVAR